MERPPARLRGASARRYPALPVAMRSDRSGAMFNVTQAWLRGGFGISRAGCTLQPAWNAWRCPREVVASHRMLVIESLDVDRETRRIRCKPAVNQV